MEVVGIGTPALGLLDIGTLGLAGLCTDNAAGLSKSTATSPTLELLHQNIQSRESRIQAVRRVFYTSGEIGKITLGSCTGLKVRQLEGCAPPHRESLTRDSCPDIK